MSLHVYTKKSDIENAGLELITLNDMYFDYDTDLVDSELVQLILSTVDRAEYNGSFTFIGRSKSLGALNKCMLSTGTKTLLNVIAHTDKCFDVCECGDNALSILPEIKSGNIYWRIPAVACCNITDCDIIYNGKQYTDFYKFLDEVNN